jgi:hypothetical protein
MVDDVLHPTGAPRAAAKNIFGKAFREDLPAAQDGVAAEPAHRQIQTDLMTRLRQI